jgi:putative endonuclease
MALPSGHASFKMFYTYILKSEKNKSFYIGSCEDLCKRINTHNKGRVKSTKANIPWALIYKEEFLNRGDAIDRETKIKSWKSRKAIEKLIVY